MNPLNLSKWIGGDTSTVSPIILRRFMVQDIQKADLYVTGLGYFEARVNNKLVSDERFVPLISDYEPRPLHTYLYPLHDTLTHSIYYNHYDITTLLKEGENILSVQLGNGWYRQTERIAEGNVSFGEDLKAIFCMVLENASGSYCIYSDGSETWRESEIVYSNLFVGEVINPLEVGTEKPVRLLSAPKAALREQIGTPDRVIRRITPEFLGIMDGKKVFDVGENISGVVRIHTSAKRGEEIRLRFSEELDENLMLNFESTGSEYRCSSGKLQIMTDLFIADGCERDFEPKFVWHAFRYFDIEGDFDSAEVLVIHSDTPITATFESASEGLQFLYDAFLRTQLDNMHGSIPSDCPHRERLGYTGDGQVCAPAAMMLLESQEFYKKWIQDILDCQDLKTGHVQHTAPLMGGGGGPGGWGCAIVLVPYAYYKQFGDVAILKKCYEPMKHWIQYLLAHSEDDLVIREEKDGWCLGDWCTLDPIQIPEPFVNTCYLLKCLRLLCEIAVITGHNEDVKKYEIRIENVASTIRKTYYHPMTGHYCNGVQGADAYAVWSGLAGKETAEMVKKLDEKYRIVGHFDTGFLGTDILMEVLMDYGYADTALQLLESENMGSFLYMKRHGATTLWENWSGESSHNHPMFGACVRQLFTGFLGIRQVYGSAGYLEVEIAPRIPRKLSYAKGSICTPQGEIMVSWIKKDDEIEFCVRIPKGINAVFHYVGECRRLSEGENFWHK